MFLHISYFKGIPPADLWDRNTLSTRVSYYGTAAIPQIKGKKSQGDLYDVNTNWHVEKFRTTTSSANHI